MGTLEQTEYKLLFVVGCNEDSKNEILSELKLDRKQIKKVLNLSKYPIYYLHNEQNTNDKKEVKKVTLQKMYDNDIQSIKVGWFGFKLYNDDNEHFDNYLVKMNKYEKSIDFETFLTYIRLTKTPKTRAELSTYICTIKPIKYLHQIVKNRRIKPTFEHASDMGYMMDQNGKTRAYIMGAELIADYGPIKYPKTSGEGYKDLKPTDTIPFHKKDALNRCNCCKKYFFKYATDGIWFPIPEVDRMRTCKSCVKKYKTKCVDCETETVSIASITQCGRCTDFYNTSSDIKSWDATPPVWFKYDLDYVSKNKTRLKRGKFLKSKDYLTDLSKKKIDGSKKLVNLASNKLLFGLEYEFWYHDEDEGYFVNDSIIDALPYLRLYFTEDGSVSGGAELHTHAMTYKSIKKSGLIEHLENEDINAFNNACGLHVHLNRDAFTKYHLYRFSKFILENGSLSLYVARRKSLRQVNEYSRWYADEILGTLKGILRREGSNVNDMRFGQKYRAINFKHSRTIELRFFGNTKTPKYFYAKLEYLQAVYEMTRHDLKIDNGVQFLKYVKMQGKYPNLMKMLKGASVGGHFSYNPIQYSKGAPKGVELNQ